jgi:hypothetical protein
LSVLGEYFPLDGEEGARLTISGTPEFQEGDLVEAVGFPYLGGGSLRLDGIVARKIGHAPLPAPKRLSGDALISPMHDATRIRIEGTLARVKTSTNELVLEVQVGAWRLVSRLNTLASTARRGSRPAARWNSPGFTQLKEVKP